ncbi:LuxR C-terminal-related transcriptional regulator, partial [Microbacterium sp. NPDC078428]|uniref:helix-turn-helix transcriptional regulator n=1 Tax=Microbacterium sp. NPDC078428 TaxID=3364190 RepID=UPI0037CCB6B9
IGTTGGNNHAGPGWLPCSSSSRVRSYEQSNGGIDHQPVGFRALVSPDIELLEELEAFRQIDERFTRLHARIASIPQEGPPPGPRRPLANYELPRIVRDGMDALRGALSGDISHAIEMASRAEIPEPSASMLAAFAALLTNRNQDALDHLDKVKIGWGDRIEVMVALLRAQALMRLDRREAARHTLDALLERDPALVAQSATLIPAEEISMLEEHSEALQHAARAAQITGTIRSRMLLSNETHVPALTKREQDILEGLREGLSTMELAERHFLSANTVKTHVRALSRKLQVSGRPEIVRRAKELRLLS